LLIMLHKPAGVITSTSDGGGPTVMSCIPDELNRKDLAPIGRLDKDTTGLLLLTTDGGLTHALTHPRRHVEKAYLATLSQPLPAEAVQRFAAGVELADGTLCAPALLEILSESQARVVLREGKYHQVKRMVAACGSSVTALHRERIGDLWLDPALQPGMARAVSLEELALLGLAWPGTDGAELAETTGESAEDDGVGDGLPQ
jgi:16S rRNA pseudouridine516 synthase